VVTNYNHKYINTKDSGSTTQARSLENPFFFSKIITKNAALFGCNLLFWYIVYVLLASCLQLKHLLIFALTINLTLPKRLRVLYPGNNQVGPGRGNPGARQSPRATAAVEVERSPLEREVVDSTHDRVMPKTL